ncbi:MAG: hypothetical protein Q4F85_15760 [Prevotella sp.]|nr:hypothetical protein [Prevotella sp.]
MDIPKLTMKREDVQTAMARTFKRDVKLLKFSRKYDILKVSGDGVCTFTLQDEYMGAGEYRYMATVELEEMTDMCIKSSKFRLDGRVSVTSDESNSPVIQFLDTISINKCL